MWRHAATPAGSARRNRRVLLDLHQRHHGGVGIPQAQTSQPCSTAYQPLQRTVCTYPGTDVHIATDFTGAPFDTGFLVFSGPSYQGVLAKKGAVVSMSNFLLA